MKLAYILNTYPQPSHSFIRREIRALEAQGHTVLRLAMRPSDATLVDTQDVEESVATKYILEAGGKALLGATWRALRRDAVGFWSALKTAVACGKRSEVGILRHLIYLAEAASVAEACKAAEITHAHAHFGTNAAAVAMLSHMLGGPRYSMTVHGPEEFDAPRTLSLGTKVANSEFTVAISSYGRSQLCRWAGAKDWAKIEVVHCGIDPSRFPEPAPLPKGPARFVAIGRFVEQKGQLILLDAMARLRASHPDTHLTLIGDGELRPQIEARVDALGIRDQVTLTGWVDEARILSELEAAHALVMPSFGEGLPMVIMEAMAAGRLVIATYIAGTPELVKEGETGWLVPASDVQAFADAMANLAATKPSKRSTMAKAGRDRCLARHDVDNEAQKLARLMAR
ncbi:colanic acid biosynthesis glycosyltransferase WcaL [Sulfitobacter sp. SK012]|uniref:glycosyltransferase family 4 protein n=1 Tax=Sulfitobacter sp. SK012 TaxID=1389005 RepID=UPI000E0A023D|nr:glycosyltransferase family 4 protein [Sulfitobacter sp. SK012]AXI45928.1 colanic acid biosynthesis glycosyltransferase WcaL [Sulfitobacter sp. SK012]